MKINIPEVESILTRSTHINSPEIGRLFPPAAPNASFTPKLNLQPTGFRLASNLLQTGKMQLGYICIAWFHSHQFSNQKPVGSQSEASRLQF